jgi:hypothetical protein
MNFAFTLGSVNPTECVYILFYTNILFSYGRGLKRMDVMGGEIFIFELIVITNKTSL